MIEIVFEILLIFLLFLVSGDEEYGVKFLKCLKIEVVFFKLLLIKVIIILLLKFFRVLGSENKRFSKFVKYLLFWIFVWECF